MKISFAKPAAVKGGAAVVFVNAATKLSAQATRLDAEAGGLITKAIKNAGFKGSLGQTLDIHGLPNLALTRVLVVGLGKTADLTDLAAEKAGGAIAAKLLTSGEKAVTVLLEDIGSAKLPAAEFAAHVATGCRLRSYRFHRYRTKLEADRKPSLEKVVLMTAATGAAQAFARLEAVNSAVVFARDLVSEPGNVIYPNSYAQEIRKLAKLGLKIEVLGVKEMKKLGMGALLGVAQGSANEPRLVVMEWRGGKNPKAKPLAFVGKGVTFDTGGISLKAGAGMEEMKYDMAGSAAVVGAMMALAARKAKVNAVGVVGLVENMPSHKAQRPGDVVTSMSGQTIEVVNTDAEGRLVLADALWYTQYRFKPQFMVDLATLTGAIIISLGHEYAGLFSNDDVLAKRLTDAGDATGELLWRLPVGEMYDKDISSDIADMHNVGAAGRGAGSIAGAIFLKRFINNVPWAHLDIAGMAWTKKERPVTPKGATGFGVRLLDRLVTDYYEGK